MNIFYENEFKYLFIQNLKPTLKAFISLAFRFMYYKKTNGGKTSALIFGISTRTCFY